MKSGTGIAVGLLFIGAILGGVWLTKAFFVEGLDATEMVTASAKSSNDKNLSYNPPSLDDVPEGEMGESILFGYELVNDTNNKAEQYVGNNLTCTSCHAGAGLDENSSSLVGMTAVYPQYIERSGGIVTIEERINGCMVRSMNGKKFEANSDELEAIVSYFKYISKDIPVGADMPWRMNNSMENVPVPSVANGEEIYQKSCITCHAADGAGTGPNTGPALWGEDSFNDGAGLARLSKLAGYVKNNMPAGGEGTLTDQDASDLAAFILSQDRPVWANHDKDWPKGNRPKDIMDKENRQKVKDGTIDWKAMLTTKQ
ncbi:c-type cytochrome [Viridibacillus sp. FSL R5-0477]|uniref:Class I cytochrome c n=1 Tax=Viridibacillus arenosi FSL R5-213 TaxID=1227360 RepID=W4EQ36_9BACL|nr:MULTISPECIES: c-type cytochrome [Viridibacillus]ETT82705.1 class I cytochrome c [Viridibacillus arenosi FSL R5-213]OMC82321.1 C cytochrome [Viridibacillus sp. FSL H7-0596]OMC85661.1 C cytochrome [Viridibacillus sp. FSL H8-0123]OMC92224.1 C cytochrome [Viridibacillus arenosi]